MNSVTLSSFPQQDLGGVLTKFEQRAREVLPRAMSSISRDSPAS
jgi:hypothetical protein